ncbi:MAG: hypothetical protein IJ808_02665 [Muribaculaceae bacterium]|nr:hypothetical protein [Muribaculaceae bacterium]
MSLKTHFLKAALTCSVMLLCGARAGFSAAAQSQLFDYSAITFTWTDDAGTRHTAKLTDKATDPNHIMALLNEVYTNPQVPGVLTYQAYNTNGTKNGKPATINYDLHARVTVSASAKYASWISLREGVTKVQAPQEGMTMLFVQVKNSW